jgi:hypothetical protein
MLLESLRRLLGTSPKPNRRPTAKQPMASLRVFELEDRTVPNATFNFTVIPGTSAQAVTGFQAAAENWSAVIKDNITINLTIGFVPLGTSIIGETSSTQLGGPYSLLRTALVSHATSADDLSSSAALPTGSAFKMLLNYTKNSPNGVGSPTPYLDADGDANNTTIEITSANAKTLGLIAANTPGEDASVQFNSDFNFDFDPSDGIAANSLDFIGVATHEIGHALGFDSGVDLLDGNSSGTFFNDNQFPDVTPLDLFRFSTASVAAGGIGTIDWTAGNSPKFLSVNGGATLLTQFSTGQTHGDGSQASHWKDNLGLGIMDPTAAFGEHIEINKNDLQAFDIIGYNIATAGPLVYNASSNPSVSAYTLLISGHSTQIVESANHAHVLATQLTSLVTSIQVVGQNGVDDAFTIDFSNGSPIPSGGLTFDGGTGSNTLIAPNVANAWSITGIDAGSIAGVVTSFQNVQNLTGGSQADTFTFAAAGHLDGTIDGGGGADTIQGADVASIWTFTGANVGSIDSGGAHFVNIENLIGGSAADVFAFGAAGSFSGTIDGGLGENMVAGPNVADAWSITGTDAGSIAGVASFKDIQDLTGGSANDSFMFAATAHIDGTIDGGDGTDTMQGVDVASIWTFTGANVGFVDSVGAHFANIENLIGGSMTDVFAFSAAGSFSGTIDGGLGENWLDYSGVSGGVVVDFATGTASRISGSIANIRDAIGSALGGDTLIAGTIGGVLVGHGKGNTLTGNAAAASVLIGGSGTNLIYTGAGGDLAIAGSTAYDADYAVLASILAEWQSTNSYAIRTADLRNGGGLNGTNRLVQGSTVFSPTTAPGPKFGNGGGAGQTTIISADDGLNWYFTLYASAITGRRLTESVN